ncbi:MAG: response regulator transcription factor [Phycisphaerales bacterium JB040]
MTDSSPVIAVVDDDASVCRALARLVRSLGMTASTFASGDDFLSALVGMPAFSPDCVILDVQMPGSNGIAVQARLRERIPAPPVVFITAHDAAEVREQALAAGAIAYLRKPISDDLLVRTLDQALRRETS